MPFVTSDGCKIKYHVVGKGKPLIFISGLGMDHRVWIYQIPIFSKRFMVVVFDNRGIGESTYDGKRFSTYTMARDVIGLMNALHIKKANIVGSSLGGMVAQEIAINFQERVDKLILSSTTAKLRRKSVRGDFFRNVRNIIKGEIDVLIDVDPHHPIFNRAINHILINVYSKEFLLRNKSLVKRLAMDYFSKDVYYEVLLRQVGAVIRHDTRRRLYKIKADTMILSGTNDKIVPCEHGEELAERIKKSRFVRIEGGSHGLHLEKPEEFNRKVMDFILE